MYYFALLQTPPRDLAPEDFQAEMQAYTDFHARARSAIRGGDALGPAAEGVRIDGGPDHPVITDGPFAEGAEVAGGFYVFEADNLDDALELAKQVPAARYGAVEVWPIVHFNAPEQPTTGSDWLALLLEPAAEVAVPGSDEWNAMAGRHVEFGAAAGAHVLSGAPCIRRARRRRSGYATARCCSPTVRSPRAPKWRTASICCGRRIGTRQPNWRR